MVEKITKIKLKVWSYIIKMSKQKNYYPLLYRAYWYCLFNKKTKYLKNSAQQYFTAMPNSGAGIGHQMANWISGYWFAKEFGVAFAHSPFSLVKWDAFLGFGENEKTLHQLIKDENYKKVKLPLFDENKPKELRLIQKIIDSYSGKKVVFVCEQDQFYKDQYGVLKEMQQKFYSSTTRKEDKLQYDTNAYNVAIHVRRGDIVAGQNKIENHTMRWLTNDYFLNALQNTLDYISTDKKVNIYLFSQGKEADFIEFEKFLNLNYCLDMGAIDSFLHMVMADALITSKSSFSYKPALLNKGLKIVPTNFWHSYPKTKDWIQVSDEGQLLTAKT
jgi:hypothetical protein